MTSETGEHVRLEAEAIIRSIDKCVPQSAWGGDAGKMCHVWLDSGNKCQCGDVDLMKERLR